jgi:hypothetical protein
VFKAVPLQEGEEGQTEVFDITSDLIPPYPDPLGILVDMDLRASQLLFASGRLGVKVVI